MIYAVRFKAINDIRLKDNITIYIKKHFLILIIFYFKSYIRDGMTTLAVKFDEHAVDVSFTKNALHFVLADGREISAPLEWFPRLRDANEKDRNNWRLIGNGIGVHC